MAVCASCGRTLCITCAVPVRSAVYGNECLAKVLGDDVPEQAGSPLRPPPTGGVIAVTALFVDAVIGTALPWTRFQEGSGPFGAWGLSPRWSMLAALASVAGLVASIVAWRGRDGAVVSALRSSAALVVAGSVLAIARPPAFAPPWLGPWVSLAGGIGALGVSFGVLRQVREREPQSGHAHAS